MRLEKDSLGELEVPDEAYYGVQTVRCSGNYKIGNHTYNEFPEVIRAMAEIKKACAITNSEIGALNHVKAEAICKAADELIAGKRPLVAMGLHRQSAHLLRHRYPYLAVYGV